MEEGRDKYVFKNREEFDIVGNGEREKKGKKKRGEKRRKGGEKEKKKGERGRKKGNRGKKEGKYPKFFPLFRAHLNMTAPKKSSPKNPQK